MPWFLVSYFFGGALVANAIPHLVADVSGRPFHSPFASSPFRELCSPVVNVAWGLTNLAAAGLLLLHVGDLDIRNWRDSAVCFTGFGAMAFQCVRSVTRIRAERDGQDRKNR